MLRRLIAPLAVALGVLIGAAIPLLFNPTFYYVDDSQTGAWGQWWRIGERLLHWDWSLVDPTVWQSGDYLAEGSWGLFSPIMWAIGLTAHVLPSGTVCLTVVKAVFLVVAGLGVRSLAKEFGARERWAVAVGVAAPLTGFTLYMDAASWVNGLTTWALLPFTWVLLRRTVLRSASPIPFIVLGCLLVGIGYVHATLMLAVLVAVTIAEALFDRDRRAALRALVAGAAVGSFAVVVFLPSVLIAPVSGRASSIANDGLLTVPIGNLLAAATPVGSPLMPWFGGLFPIVPVLYCSWLLPLAAFVPWRRFIASLRSRPSLPLYGLVALLGVMLPSQVGPLRYPVRLLPYFWLAVLILLAVGLSARGSSRVGPRRLAVAVGTTLVSAIAAFGFDPSFGRPLAVVAAVSAALVIAVWAAQRWGVGRFRFTARRGAAAVAATCVLGTLVLLVPQHAVHPAAPLRNDHLPSRTAALDDPIAGAEGDLFVVGSIANGEGDAALWDETRIANLFYFVPSPVQNAYSSVEYPGYRDAFCMQYDGLTCPQLYRRLFRTDPTTGRTLADLTGISSVQVIKESVPASDWHVVPRGWHVTHDSAETRVIARDTLVPGAGGVVSTSKGLSVETLRHDAMGVAFRVTQAGRGGQVVLSRIPWPGYHVNGAKLAAHPTRSFLLTVDVPRSAVGRVVTVSYVAPGWQGQLAGSILLIVILVGWAAVRLRSRRGAHDRLQTVFGRRSPACVDHEAAG